jgi:hypothetical protein
MCLESDRRITMKILKDISTWTDDFDADYRKIFSEAGEANDLCEKMLSEITERYKKLKKECDVSQYYEMLVFRSFEAFISGMRRQILENIYSELHDAVRKEKKRAEDPLLQIFGRL